MAEFIATEVQTVQANQNVLFTNTLSCGKHSIIHREGSGLVTLRGVASTQCRARFQVIFGANVAIPTGGAVDPISVAISINGEPILSSTMMATPAAVEEYFNINRTLFIDIPTGCCSQISVKNISGGAINVQNANLIVQRIA